MNRHTAFFTTVTPGIRAMAIFLLAATAACSTGCVQRRLMVRSDPPGATVYVDDYEIGTTPIATNFTYYGKRQIRLVKDGYETLTVMQPIPMPWYEIPPLDLVSECIVPGELRDTRTLCYSLKPQAVLPTDQLLRRADELRLSAPSGTPPANAPGALPQGGIAPGRIPPGEQIPAPPSATPLPEMPWPSGTAPAPPMPPFSEPPSNWPRR